jgi:hypothetical protein
MWTKPLLIIPSARSHDLVARRLAARDTVAAIGGSFRISWVPEALSSIATLVGCMAIPAFAGAHPAK